MTTPYYYNWDDLPETPLEIFSPPREEFLTNAPLDYMQP